MTGWIKLHRKIFEWEWYNDANTFRLFIHLLINANREVSAWRGEMLSPGQLITGRKILANELKLSERQIRTSISRLKSTGEIAIKSTNKFSIITICKWGEYQDNDREKRPAKSPTNDHKQEDKNNKKNISVKFDAFRKEYPGTKRGLEIELENFKKKNDLEVIELLLPALKKEIAHKYELEKSGEFCPPWKNLSTWINQKCWEQEFPAVKTTNGFSHKELDPPKGLKR